MGASDISLQGHSSVEILVVGSGAGGAVTAAILAEAGYEVTIVEEGQAVDIDTIWTNTSEAIQSLYRNGGMTPMFGKPNMAFAEGCCVGGSTEVNSAFWQRPQTNVVEQWVKRFQIQDLQPKSLEPIFDTIESNLGIVTSGEGPLAPSSEVFRRGMESTGLAAKEVARAIRSNRSESSFSPGVRRSMSQTYIPVAIRAGAKLLNNTRVTKINHRNGRIVDVVAVHKSPNGNNKFTVRPDAVFLCGGPIQTPLLLRRSGIKRNIGNTLGVHPMLKMAALFDDRMDSHKTAIPIYQADMAEHGLTFGGSVFTPGFLAMTLAENLGRSVEFLQDWRNMAMFYVASRSTTTGSVRAFPLTGEPFIRYSLPAESHRNLGIGLAKLGEALFAGGAKTIFPAFRTPTVLESPDQCRQFMDAPPGLLDLKLSTVHAFGTCPMGEDKAICATSSFGKVHGFGNLYLSDASIIPDSPGANPQATVMALATRNARHFVDRLA